MLQQPDLPRGPSLAENVLSLFSFPPFVAVVGMATVAYGVTLVSANLNDRFGHRATVGSAVVSMFHRVSDEVFVGFASIAGAMLELPVPA